MRDRDLPKLDVILRERQSLRGFGPLGFDDFSDLAWLALKQRRKLGDDVSLRPYPTFGGLGAIRCVILNVPGTDRGAGIYDAATHTIGLLPCSEDRVCSALASFDEAVSIGKATVFCFVADALRALSRYENPESLIWRESGVISATLSMVAQGLGLSTCLIGKTGTSELGYIIGERDYWMPCGAIAIGPKGEH